MNTTTTSIEENEEWRVIAEFPNYEVSNLGRVRSWQPLFNSGKRPEKPHVMSMSPNMAGYTIVSLAQDGMNYGRLLHRLVATAFCEKADPSYKIVRHDDGNARNCRATNLIWGTPAQNREDQFRHGNASHGERCFRSKLTNDQAREIFNDGASTCTQLALKYGVTPSTISDIRCGHSRKRNGHEGKSPGAVGMGGRRQMKKLTAEDARAIFVSPKSPKSIAQKYGISQPLVCRIQNREKWAAATLGLEAAERELAADGRRLRVDSSLKKLTEEQVREIFLSPLTGRQIAQKIGVNEGHVSMIRARKACELITKNLLAPERIKLQKLDADRARDIFLSTGSTSEVGDQFGVSDNMISLIRRRLSWAHATKDLPGVVAGV